MARQVLVLDQAGQPLRWGSYEDAIVYHAKGLVAWQLGDESHTTFRGGENSLTGEQSVITTAPIIAVRGEVGSKRKYKAPTLTNRDLFARDRWTCAYCSGVFHEAKLTRDHVLPVSRGGKDIWENVVTSCGPCNNRKDNFLLTEVGMELTYYPYVPSRADVLFMKARGILPCQAEYLLPFCSDRARLSFEGIMNQTGAAVDQLLESFKEALPKRPKKK